MKVLIVLTSHDQLGDTGRKTGFWLEELAAPVLLACLADVGITVEQVDEVILSNALGAGGTGQRGRAAGRDTEGGRAADVHRHAGGLQPGAGDPQAPHFHRR